jgi:hypothetical protein
MTFPALIFGVLLAALVAAVYHFWKGTDLKRLVLYGVFSEAGFWAGQGIAAALHWEGASVGPLHVLLGTLGSVIFLLIGDWLSQVEIRS